MLLLLRKVLFYILLILYLIITPYLILYGLGYGINPAERELFKTGLVSVSSEPKDATIHIEGRKFFKKTPAVVRGLLPGTYQVRVSRKGFEPWSKEIQIFPEKATRLEPVILVSQKPDFETLTDVTYRNLLIKAKDNKIFALRGELFSDLTKIDLLFKKDLPLGKGSPLEEVRILDWKTKKDSQVILLKVKNQGKTGYWLYDLGREKNIADLTGYLPEETDSVDWDKKNPEAVFFLKDRQITGFDFEKRALFLAGAPDSLGFSVSRHKLYILKSDFSLWQGNLKGEKLEPLPDKENPGGKIFSGIASRFYQIEILKRELFQKELILFMSEKGALLSNWPPYQLVEKGVLEIQPTATGDSEKVLYWTKNEIGMLDFSFNPEEEQNLPPRVVLYRSGTNIRQAFWAYENSHVLFQDGNEVFLLEAGGQAPYQVRAIQTVASGTDILYHEQQNSLFYLDSESRKIIKRKITE